jgi:glycosyltransferase involved in cell wall biosynthesis
MNSRTGRDKAHSATAPVVSFVIPTRNEASYIGGLLSELRQAREEGVSLETVVVDGGSSDSTVEQARLLADLVIADEPLARVSIAHARNLGAARARGSILFHTDADVRVPNLKALLDGARSGFGDPGLVALTVPVMPYPWESTARDRFIHLVANAFFRSSLHYGALFARGECQIVSRSAFESVGGYSGKFISGEDCDLFRRLNRIGRISYLPRLRVYHSTRRFRELGYLRVFCVYLREWIWMNLLRRSYLSEWPVIR